MTPPEVAGASVFSLQVFVSSACHELRDLRAAVRTWLVNFGIKPMLSNEIGFPHVSGATPCVSCLRVLEECQLVIGIVDRRYGTAVENWGPYPYNGLSPTHAELRHALSRGKRLLLFVHRDTMAVYEQWQKTKSAFVEDKLENGLQVETLRLIEELKRREPEPWIREFEDVTDIIKCLQADLVNQVYLGLQEEEERNADVAGYLLNRIYEAAPEVRSKIESKLSPERVAHLEELKRQLLVLEEQTQRERTISDQLRKEKQQVLSEIARVTKDLEGARLALAKAAIKDASWLTFIRTRLMPEGHGQIPFHNSAEVALRGFHVGNPDIPVLESVTWSRLPYTEEGKHRGFRAGLLFKGSKFAPGITVTHRRIGQASPSPGQSDYFWQQPNIYFGDYLELSTHDDADEGPLS